MDESTFQTKILGRGANKQEFFRRRKFVENWGSEFCGILNVHVILMYL